MFFISKVSRLVENIDGGIYLDTINVINIKLSMMTLHIELYLFIPFSVTLAIFQSHINVGQFKLKIYVLIKLGRNLYDC